MILGVYLYFLDSFIISKDSQGYARKLFCNKFYFRWIFLGLMIYTTYLFGILFDFNLQTVLTKLNVSSVDGGGILNNYLDGISDFLKNSKNNIINNPFF
ncbi:hypothetical protein A2229_00600 [Candidatus Peregrinibacteria bacterium RIFOXYA2_FULL_33_7]|nr:MAG: hypothetical protein A2229_00600 [Candidatus Peregrinibacteria bacterium RIFOXYA2_FULL_33_7]